MHVGRRSLALVALCGLTTLVTAPAARAVDATAPVVEHVTGADAVALAAALSARTFPARTTTVYLASAVAFPDALAAGGAAGGTSPILLVDPSGLAATTRAELQRLAPTQVIALGGTAAIPDSVTTAARAAVPGATVTRIAGADRYETAAATSARRFPQGATTAYLATGADFPDALAAGAASAGSAPILLTRADAVPPATLAELRRLAVQSVVVLGGAAAVTDATVSALRTALPTATVTRVAGADRYATAAKLARTVPPTAAATVVVAPGTTFAAALVASPAAARSQAPLLLVDGQPTSAAAAELARRGLRRLLVVGDASDAATAAVENAAAPSIPAPLPGAATAVQTAQAQLGKDYRYGAAGPDAYDCSGLTLVAWAAGGVTLPRIAEDQAYAVHGVPFTAIQPGDLLFYGSPITHVGIYQGDGTMIEAAHTGVPVRTASIWRPDLVAAGRPTG